MVFVVGEHRLNHKADVVALELFAIYWEALLTPAESDYLESVDFRKFSHNLPEEFYPP